MRFIVLLVTFLVVGNAIMGDRGLISMIRADGEMEELSHSIKALQALNDALREDARRLREDPWRIEELARSKLGLIRPGETLFILTDRNDRTNPPPAAPAETAPRPTPPAEDGPAR